MVTTNETSPSPLLASFIRCYSLRTFDTGGAYVVKPWYACHELYMPFFFGAVPVQLINHITGKTVYGHYGGAVGPSTHYNGDMTFYGSYAFFSMHFKPNGFSRIFRLPSREFTNNIIGANDFLDASVRVMYEQLLHVHESRQANKLAQMAALADAYLLARLRNWKSADGKDSITCISNLIVREAGMINVHRLAGMANMSLRTFERSFQEQIGTSPKLFCRVIRFNNALTLKLKAPGMDWTSVALESGYFDQMHFIKDFREFTGSSPSAFLKETPLLEKDFSNRVNT